MFADFLSWDCPVGAFSQKHVDQCRDRMTRRTVSYYDSMGDDGDEYTGSVFRYLCDEHVNIH